MDAGSNIFNGSVVFGMSGESDTGKTELLCDVIKKLSERGYDTATIKHSKGDFTIDQEGKDTWRHAKAGAGLVIFSTPSETDFLLKNEMSLKEILNKVETFGGFDAVLIEGMKEEDIPQIFLEEGKSAEDLDETVDNIEYEIKKKRIWNRLPGLNCGDCGFENCEKLAEAVLEEKRTLSDCEKLKAKTDKVHVRVDGKDLPLGRFPSKMIDNTMKGMISSLKGIDDIDEVKKIEIEIEE